MTDEEARRRIAAARVGRLASIDPAGRPHVVPICFTIEGNRIVSVVDAKPKRTLQLRRLENVRRRPDVQLLVDHYDDDWATLWWVRISGRASVIEHGPDRERAIELLARKYRYYVEQPPEGPAMSIDIVRIQSWAAATTGGE